MDSTDTDAESRDRNERTRKRKHEQDGPEIEVDVNLPEPLSKKAKRKDKKSQQTPKATGNQSERGTDRSAVRDEGADAQLDEKEDAQVDPKPANKRSDYGIWIGNLSFSTTKSDLLTFLLEKGDVAEEDVTRVNMPAPPDKKESRHVKPQNKGFAYVDFTTSDILARAIGLSEQLLGGRKVLIKNAKNFEGRPDKPKSEANGNGTNGSAKTPTKRIFVGNLGFDVSKADLEEHFAQAGTVDDIHMATFEDSGKCKGFAWIRFDDIESAKAAVDGFVWKTPDVEQVLTQEDQRSSEEDGDSEAPGEAKQHQKSKRKAHKPRKWFINRLHGRQLRCEFAEDAQTRYKKRFGPSSKSANGTALGQDRHRVGAADLASTEPDRNQDETLEGLVSQAAAARESKGVRMPRKGDKDERQQERRKRHENKMQSAPKPVTANKVHGTALIGTGKKIVFD